jgi:ADP-dependent NAD(P)H-hydrate dehydratase / NAD(P)H-hydrate epimerase
MISSQDVKKLEENSESSKIALMENAGRRVYETIKEKYGLKDKRILVICYHGNNGGDGFVSARYLCDEAETDVMFIGDESKLKDEAHSNYKRIEYNEKIQLVDEELINYEDYDIIIDAIFGIGFKGIISQEVSSIMDSVNESKAIKVSLDIPSGLVADSKELVNKFIKPDMIITFHDMKKILENFKDKTIVVDIGM